MRLALFQPDIPQNTGALIRLAACLGVAVDIIEPCGFPLSDKSLRRAGMDYLDLAALTLHSGWQPFLSALPASGTAAPPRLVLLTTRARTLYTDISYRPDDVLLVGRESAGVPPDVHRRADLPVRIPLHPKARSLNVATAPAIVLGEALRQTGGFPAP